MAHKIPSQAYSVEGSDRRRRRLGHHRGVGLALSISSQAVPDRDCRTCLAPPTVGGIDEHADGHSPKQVGPAPRQDGSHLPDRPALCVGEDDRRQVPGVNLVDMASGRAEELPRSRRSGECWSYWHTGPDQQRAGRSARRSGREVATSAPARPDLRQFRRVAQDFPIVSRYPRPTSGRTIRRDLAPPRLAATAMVASAASMRAFGGPAALGQSEVVGDLEAAGAAVVDGDESSELASRREEGCGAGRGVEVGVRGGRARCRLRRRGL